MDYSKSGAEKLFFVFIGLSLCCICLLCFNSKEKDNSSSSRAAGGKVKFKVAMILPGTKSDLSWNQSCFLGLERIRKELGAETAFTEDTTPENAYILIAKYAAAGFDLVIAAGSEFSNAAYTAAASFPRTSFMIVGPCGGNNDNLGSVSFRDGEMVFLAGALAGLKTASGKVALISYNPDQEHSGGTEMGLLFERGANFVKPGTKTSYAQMRNPSGREEGIVLTRRLIEEGNDILALDTRAEGLQIHAFAGGKGCKTIGWIMDQRQISPGTVISSCLEYCDAIILEGARLARLGRWEGKNYKFGLFEQAQDLAPFCGSLSAEQEESIKDIKRYIVESRFLR